MSNTATPSAPQAAGKKLSLKENYALLTRDLGWDPSYQKPESR